MFSLLLASIDCIGSLKRCLCAEIDYRTPEGGKKNWRQIWTFPLCANAFRCHSQLREQTEVNGLMGTQHFIIFM